MAKSLNTFIVSGRLGSEPYAGSLPSGDTYALLNVALNKLEGNTDWVSVKIYGRIAEIVLENAAIGDLITVHGYLSFYNREGQDSKIELIGKEVVF